MKNIPVAGKAAYTKCLLGKMGSLVDKMRWKVWHFERDQTGESGNNTYGFRSVNTPPAAEQLTAFEEDLYSQETKHTVLTAQEHIPTATVP